MIHDLTDYSLFDMLYILLGPPSAKVPGNRKPGEQHVEKVHSPVGAFP